MIVANIRKDSFVMSCAIWYYLYNFNNVKNTHLCWKYHYFLGVFHVFKIVQMVPNRAKGLVWVTVNVLELSRELT